MPEPVVIPTKAKRLFDPLSLPRRRVGWRPPVSRSWHRTAEKVVRHHFAAMTAVRGYLIPFGPAAIGGHVEASTTGALGAPGFDGHHLPRCCVRQRSYTARVVRSSVPLAGSGGEATCLGRS
jgi:hypothetical protein